MSGPGARAARVALLATAGLACSLAPPPPAWELPPPPVASGAIVEAHRLHRSSQANGLRLIVLEDRSLPLVGFGVSVRRGGAVVPPEQAGLARFTAELMERGAGERGALELAELIDSMGAVLSVSAGWDSMDVSVAGLSRDSERLLSILADVVLRPRFDPEEAAKVRAEQLAALERSKDEPAGLVHQHFARVLYEDHPFGSPLVGRPETVKGLDAARAREFHRRLFTASNAVFHASGDVDAGPLAESVADLLGDWEAGTPPEPGPEPPPRTPIRRRIVVVDRPEAGQAQIVVGHEGIARGDPDRIAAGLLEAVVGSGGFSSRLTSRVRAEEGLTYSVYAGFSMRRRPGPFFVYTFTRVSEVRRTVEAVLSVLEEARERPPTPDELRHVQSYKVGRFALALETSAAVASSLVDLDVHGLPEDSLDTYRDRVRAVSVEDTARLARALLAPARAAIVVVGPADSLREQLAPLGPVEVVAP